MGTRRNFGAGNALERGSRDADRRRACRYPVVFQDTLLGWWEDATFVNVAARLIDLSMNGCLAELTRHSKLSTSQSVWVRPHSSSLQPWVEARVIAVRKPLFGKTRVRIAFLLPFEYDTFKKLVYGPECLRDVSQSESLEHEKDEFWKMNPGRNSPPDA